MKIIFTLLLLISLTAYSQKKTGFGQIAASGFISEKYGNKFGVSATGGIGVGDHTSIGAGADFYVFTQEDNSNYAQLYADFRYYISGLSKKASPFIAFQPGGVLYNKNNTKGSFAVNGLAGFFIKGKGIGGTMSVGISHITFKTPTNNTLKYTGLKINAGIFL